MSQQPTYEQLKVRLAQAQATIAALRTADLGHAGTRWRIDSAHGQAQDERPNDTIVTEIEQQFGFIPSFFASASDAPEVLENLWHQTVLAYLSNPIPALFKEKLFAYLSRECHVHYCFVCHCCALRPLGMAAAEILDLLQQPGLTSEKDVEKHLHLLADVADSVENWPDPDSALEQTLFQLSISLFRDSPLAGRCQSELRRVLGSARYAELILFLTYIKTCHDWVKSHPEITYQSDPGVWENLGPLLKQEPRLTEFFRREPKKLIGKSAETRTQLIEQATFRSVFESGGMGMALCDANGGFLAVNTALCKFLGYSEAELLKMKVADVTHPDDQTQTTRVFDAAHSHEEVQTIHLDKKYLCRDGTVVWGRIVVTRLKPSISDSTRFVAMIQDITDRKQAEQLIRARENELAHSTRLATMGQMIAEFAHEMNQPLYAISNFTKASINKLSALKTDDAKQLLEWARRVETIASSAGTIIDRMRSFMTRTVDAMSTFELGEVVAESIELLSFDIRHFGVTVRFEPPSLRLMVCADRVQIQQVFVNLIRNACEAMQDAETQRRLTIALSRQGEFVETFVADNGPGIRMEDQQGVFDAFFTTKSKGMGLGLAVCQTIIMRHGGTIKLRSDPGSGAAFHFTLPLVMQPQTDET